MATTASVAVQRRKDINGTRVLDYLDQDFSPTSITGRYRQEVDSSGNWALKKDTSGTVNGSTWRNELSISSAGGVVVGTLAVYPTYNALTVHGDALFAGALTPTDLTTGVSRHSVGSNVAMWYAGHFAELRVSSLVADESAVTMGGRQLIGMGNILAKSVGSSDVTDTKILVRYNNFKAAGDVLFFQGPGTDSVAQVEYMRVELHATGDFVGAPAGARKLFKTAYINRDTGAVAYPAQLATTPFGHTAPTVDEIVAYEYTVTRNFEATNPTTTGATANGWNSDAVILNTGSVGDGFIDLYAQNRMTDMGTTGANSGTAAPIAGPSIEFNQRTTTAWNGIATRAMVGRLAGKYGYAAGSTLYGFAAGDYVNNVLG